MLWLSSFMVAWASDASAAPWPTPWSREEVEQAYERACAAERPPGTRWSDVAPPELRDRLQAHVAAKRCYPDPEATLKAEIACHTQFSRDARDRVLGAVGLTGLPTPVHVHEQFDSGGPMSPGAPSSAALSLGDEVAVDGEMRVVVHIAPGQWKNTSLAGDLPAIELARRADGAAVVVAWTPTFTVGAQAERCRASTGPGMNRQPPDLLYTVPVGSELPQAAIQLRAPHAQFLIRDVDTSSLCCRP